MINNLNEKSQRSAIQVDSWLSCTPQLLVYTPYAARLQLDIVGWLRDDYPDNRNEQGGWLIGRYLRDSSGKPLQAEVVEVLQAKTECRYPGYIEWSALEEIRLQQRFFEMKEELAAIDPVKAEELSVIGWWHTHPNDLPVFMSCTDMETQRLKYFKPEKYAVVLNPHKGIWRAFAGANAVEVPAIMLINGCSTSANADVGSAAAKKQPNKKKKQKRNKRKGKGKRKNKSKRRK